MMTAWRTQQAAPSWHQLSRMEIQLSMKLCNLYTAEMFDWGEDTGRLPALFYQQMANELSESAEAFATLTSLLRKQDIRKKQTLWSAF